MSGTNRLIKVSRETLSEVLAGTWKEDTVSGRPAGDEMTSALRRLLRNHHPLIVEEVFHYLKEHQQIRTDEEGFLVILDIEEPENPENIEEPLAIPPLAYLRAMLMIVWETFRHPLSTSRIDLATGRVIDRF